MWPSFLPGLSFAGLVVAPCGDDSLLGGEVVGGWDTIGGALTNCRATHRAAPCAAALAPFAQGAKRAHASAAAQMGAAGPHSPVGSVLLMGSL